MRTALRATTGLLALTWWVVPGMGLVDLSVSWDPDWPVVLEAGWGLLCTVGLGMPLLLAAARPRLARAAQVQLAVVTGALAVGAVGGQEPQMWWFFVLLGLQLAVLHLLARRAGASAEAPTTRAAPRRLLLVLAAMAAPAALTYAWSMLRENRTLHFDGDITMGVDHYAAQAALGLTLVALPAAAGLGLPGHRLLGTSAAIMTGYLGLIAYSWVDVQADLGDAWALAAMGWAAAVLVATWWPARRVARSEPEPLVDSQAV